MIPDRIASSNKYSIIVYGTKPIENVASLSTNLTSKTREHPTEEGFTGSDTRLEPAELEATINIVTSDDKLDVQNALDTDTWDFGNHELVKYLYGHYTSSEEEILVAPTMTVVESRDVWKKRKAIISDIKIEPKSRNYAEMSVTFKEVKYADIIYRDITTKDIKKTKDGEDVEETMNKFKVTPEDETGKDADPASVNSINKVHDAISSFGNLSSYSNEYGSFAR